MNTQLNTASTSSTQCRCESNGFPRVGVKRSFSMCLRSKTESRQSKLTHHLELNRHCSKLRMNKQAFMQTRFKTTRELVCIGCTNDLQRLLTRRFQGSACSRNTNSWLMERGVRPADWLVHREG